MKAIKIRIVYLFFLTVLWGLSGCTLFGLDLQEDYDRTPHTLDPKLNRTAWQYLKDRATGTSSDNLIFSRMLEGIRYAEIDSNEYKKPGRTYIFLHNDAISRGSTPPNDSFFGANLVNGKAATNWNSYSKEFVRRYFEYLIIEGEYSHYTLPPIQSVTVKTLAPAGSLSALPTGVTRHSSSAFSPNPESQMTLQVLNSSPSNTSDYPVQLNGVRNVRTSSLLATNGVVHVIDRFLTTTVPQ
ncbi:hypothetical protein [Desertivirga arenae]|uniref:hypothetical protein n=1 Tax=Desertivirga arenae TaxID=2810309 RepID=UPI001A9575DD|nr:hypothetical protein [Pedobacter sp. SYSU D00823]